MERTEVVIEVSELITRMVQFNQRIEDLDEANDAILYMLDHDSSRLNTLDTKIQMIIGGALRGGRCKLSGGTKIKKIKSINGTMMYYSNGRKISKIKAEKK